jgi:hypothetical protein
VYADNVNLFGINTDTIKKNTETLIDPSKEVGRAGQNHNVKIVQ